MKLKWHWMTKGWVFFCWRNTHNFFELRQKFYAEARIITCRVLAQEEEVPVEGARTAG